MSALGPAEPTRHSDRSFKAYRCCDWPTSKSLGNPSRVCEMPNIASKRATQTLLLRCKAVRRAAQTPFASDNGSPRFQLLAFAIECHVLAPFLARSSSGPLFSTSDTGMLATYAHSLFNVSASATRDGLLNASTLLHLSRISSRARPSIAAKLRF